MKLTIKTILRQALEERMRRNSVYSMRSFARDLMMAPSTLSEVMSGKKKLSLKKTNELIELLKIPEWQGDLLKNQIIENQNEDIAAVEVKLPEKLNENAVKSLTSNLDLGILEATHLKSFKPEFEWLAKKLDVTLDQVTFAVDRLQSVGLLRINEDGEWVDLSPFFSSTDGIPSRSIRAFHADVLSLARKKVLTQSVNERTVKTVVFSLEEEQVSEARNILNDAVARIMDLASKSEAKKDHVMCFSGQLFYLLNGKEDV